MTLDIVCVRNPSRRQVDGGLCIDEIEKGVGPNKGGPLNPRTLLI